MLGGGRPTPQDLPHLRYLALVLPKKVCASLPAHLGDRAYALGRGRDRRLRAPPSRHVLLLSPYVLQRHPAFWEHPEQFDPERFTPARAVGRPRASFSLSAAGRGVYRPAPGEVGNARGPGHDGPSL